MTIRYAFSLAIFLGTGFLATAVSPAFANAVSHGTMSRSQDMPFGKPGDLQKVDRTVIIEATEIAYSVTDLKFKVGETVKFVLVNKGEQNHELTIGDEATQQDHRKIMAEMAGMSMAEMAEHGHAMKGNSVDTEPGETKELLWTFTKPGTFVFACNYPGHAELGMEGRITVQ
jgi:uncharacterized cupredoxin-like copper-binding protein